MAYKISTVARIEDSLPNCSVTLTVVDWRYRVPAILSWRETRPDSVLSDRHSWIMITRGYNQGFYSTCFFTLS